MRRVALLLCVLMLAPVSGTWSMPELPHTDGEWVVHREEGWTHADWVALRSEGLEPLRHITATEVLVWGNHGTYQMEGESVLRGQTAEGFRVVLEPRLPSDAQWAILSMFDFKVLQLAEQNSALPTSFEVHGLNSEIFDSIPGIWWIEPLLVTGGRNDVASAIMENNSMEGHPAWDLGLNGSGVIIGVADSGIELDHGCFRENATTIGDANMEHRKVVLVNTTIDDGDHSGQANYRHGTHIAGTLVCDMWNGTVGAGTSPSHGARILFQDVVNESGWSEPSVDWLLAEAFANGAVIHSDSWGDDTEAYTLRSAEFDLWHREVPWSLAFIAPGNNAHRFYEPANARNVVAVGGALHNNSSDLYSSSSHGPTEEGLRGNFIVSPSTGIISAAADGNVSSFNDDMRSSTGTSMSTPMGASITAVIQQMVQDGWFTEVGFVPSGPQLRALLALSAESLEGGQQGGETVGPAPDSLQGWGRPNLANLIDYQTNTSQNIWIHDSYLMNETMRMGLANEWLDSNGARPLEQVLSSQWNGSDAQGPFLKQDDVAMWNLSVVPGVNLDVFLSFNQRPFGAVSDDLDLTVVLPNGTRIGANESLEGTERVQVSASELIGIGNVTIEVTANLIGIGNHSGVLGSDGDMLGFALAVKGVGGDVMEPEPESELEHPVLTVNENITQKVLIIGIDGVRSDVAQLSSQREGSAFSQMVENGAWTYDSMVGPISLSGPSWSSMLTGVWCDRHGVTDNSFEGSQHPTVPDFIERVENYNSSIKTASVVHWNEIDEEILGLGTADIQERYEEDIEIQNRAIELLTHDEELDVLFLNIDNPDSVGHGFGFSLDVPEYVAAVQDADDMAASIIGALESRNDSTEEWLIIITSDHGGGGERLKAHSPSSVEDRTTFMMVKGVGVVLGQMSGAHVVDVAVTALSHLGVPLPQGDEGLDGRPLAFDPDVESVREPICVRNDDSTDSTDDGGVIMVMGMPWKGWQAGILCGVLLCIVGASIAWIIRRKGSKIA